MVKEKCGIVGVISPHFTHKLSVSLLAAAGIQHRGQQGAGAAIYTKKGITTRIGGGLLKDVFTKRVIDEFDKPCLWSLIHLRYGTYGGYDKCNIQPCIVQSNDKKSIVVIHNGEFVEVDKLKKKLKKTSIPNGASDRPCCVCRKSNLNEYDYVIVLIFLLTC